MTKIRLYLLTLIAWLPLGAVTFAAKAAVQDASDEKAMEQLRKAINLRRQLLFADGSTVSSISESMERFKAASSKPDGLTQDFWKLVEEFENKGMLKRHGEYLMAKAPSIH